MARILNGSSQYLSASSTLLANEPISFFGWFNANNITATHTIASLGNNGANGFYLLSAAGAVAADPIRVTKNNDAGTGAVSADSSAGYSASTWQHAAAAFRSDTSRDSYLSGANKGSNATSRTDPTPDFVAIGTLLRSSASDFFGGSEAEIFFLDYAPTDAEMALLAKGIHPIDIAIPIANIRGWYPLLGNDENSMAGGYPNLSPTASPTFGSHPFQPIYPQIGGVMSW